MGFNEAVSSDLRQFFRLRGRATRAEYFYFLLFFVLLQVCAKVIKALAFFTYHSAMVYFQSVDNQLNLHQLADPKSAIPGLLMVGAGCLLVLFIAIVMYLGLLAMLVPLAAVQVRRLHDTGRTGWWVLFANLASAFGVALLVACTQAHQAAATLVLAVVGLGMFAVPLAVFVFTLMPGERSYNKYDYR